MKWTYDSVILPESELVPKVLEANRTVRLKSQAPELFQYLNENESCNEYGMISKYEVLAIDRSIF